MWSIQRYLCYIMGIVVVVYGTHRIYLISFIVVFVLVSLAVCQFISNFATEDIETESTIRAQRSSESVNATPSQPPHSPKVTNPPTPKPRSCPSSEDEKGTKKEDLEESDSSSELFSSSADSD